MFIVLLCGGDKRTQDDDIDRAVAFKNDFLTRINKGREHD
jgi:putative component of toxin-antitoxin plasmid stabilization module